MKLLSFLSFLSFLSSLGIIVQGHYTSETNSDPWAEALDTDNSNVPKCTGNNCDIFKDLLTNPNPKPDPTFPSLVYPVSYIISHMKNGTGKVPYSQLTAQINMLNSAFSSKDAKNGGFKRASNLTITFKLAAVRYIADDYLFNNCIVPTVMAQYRPKYMMPPKRHLNIYVCWCESSLGLSMLPYDYWFREPITENHYAVGPIVHWNLLPGNNMNKGLWSMGKILVHEVGHTFGLKHPYEGNCFGNETDSDMIYDTPRMTGNPLVNCENIKGRNSCPKSVGKDDMSNYMVATNDKCRNHFTPGQVLFMQTVLREYKPTLFEQKLPDCVAAINNNDTSPDLAPCLKGTVRRMTHKGREVPEVGICNTDPDNARVWAYACCPSGPNWYLDSCRQGTPNFSVPLSSL
jgi:hypothetical protein